MNALDKRAAFTEMLKGTKAKATTKRKSAAVNYAAQLTNQDENNIREALAGFLSDSRAVKIDPSLCEPWVEHDRSTQWLDHDKIESLATKIDTEGQLFPGLVREKEGGRYEIIFGCRRWQACQSINVKYLAIVAKQGELDDELARMLMDVENDQRQDLSQIEKALKIKYRLDNNVYSNISEASRVFSTSRTQIKRLLALASLPDYFLSQLSKPTDLSARDGASIAEALKNQGHEDVEAKFLAVAKSLKTDKARIRKIIDIASGDNKPAVRNFVVSHDGAVIGSAKETNTQFSLTLKKTDGSAEMLEKIRALVETALSEKTKS